MQLFVQGCFERFEYTNKIDGIFRFVLFCVTKIYPHAKTEKQEKGKKRSKKGNYALLPRQIGNIFGALCLCLEYSFGHKIDQFQLLIAQASTVSAILYIFFPFFSE